MIATYMPSVVLAVMAISLASAPTAAATASRTAARDSPIFGKWLELILALVRSVLNSSCIASNEIVGSGPQVPVLR
jgi:hypothetical protein